MKKLFKMLFVLSIIVGVISFSFVGCGSNKTSEPKVKVGIVFDIGGRGDHSFNDSAYAGLVQAAKDFGGYIKDEQGNIIENYGNNIELRYMQPSKEGGADRLEKLEELAKENYQLIIGVGFAFSEDILKAAKDYQNIHFAIVDSCYPDDKHPSNVTCLLFKENEGSFLVGAIAGLTTKTNQLGFVGGMDIPLIQKFEYGYMAGAKYVNKDIQNIDVKFVTDVKETKNPWNDPAAAKTLAEEMYNNGIDIIYHAAGGSGYGVFESALNHDKWAIGVDSDQQVILMSSDNDTDRAMADHVITSMLKKVNVAVYSIVSEMYKTGKVAEKVKVFGLKEGGVDYAYNDYNKEMLDPIKPQIDELKQKIINGEIKVPANKEEYEEFANTYLNQ